MFLMSSSRDLSMSLVVRSGFTRWVRQRQVGAACILTFHGLSDGSEDGEILDHPMHMPVQTFRAVCEHLAEHYHVVPLAVALEAQVNGHPVAAGTVAITFDDGYASNYYLAYPILKSLGLSATIFAVTGYLDRSVMPWFIRLELALSRTPRLSLDSSLAGRDFALPLLTREQRLEAYRVLCPFFKSLAQERVPMLLERLEHELEVEPGGGSLEDVPAPLLPMTWEQAREMQASGLIDFGGHTHTHPILGRCSPALMREEILLSQAKLSVELGRKPSLFAYPNGGPGDYNDTTIRLLREAGYQAAFTMSPAMFQPRDVRPYELPRYGNPTSVNELETIASGTFETLQAWRQRWGLAKA